MKCLVAALVLCVLAPSVRSASNAVDWCYHDASCNDLTWPTIAANHCNGTRQSPINVLSADATVDSSLTNFTFQNYDNRYALKRISNTGKTVKVSLASGVQVSGGGLTEAYDSLQFHLHWGNGFQISGSEHAVDGKRYAMEFHIVSVKASLNGNTTLAVADPRGAAALGFLIEEMDESESGKPESWRKLTTYLSSITEQGQEADIEPGVSLDDLLPGVDRTQFYRYLGSLTTPTCDEAVVWTLFKQPVKVSRDLINLFSNTLHIGNSSSLLMRDVYRRLQPSQPVTTTALPSSGVAPKSITFYSLCLVSLGLALGRN